MVLEPGSTEHGGSSPFALVRTLLFPFGLPSPAEAWGFVVKYWLGVFPLPLLLLAELSLVPLLAALPRRERLITLLALVVALVLMLARMTANVYGGARPEGFLHDSTPRYWSPNLPVRGAASAALSRLASARAACSSLGRRSSSCWRSRAFWK